MATTSDTVRFREGAGRLCLDFIRTLRYRGTPSQTEELPDGAALAAWIRQCGSYGLDETVVPAWKFDIVLTWKV